MSLFKLCVANLVTLFWVVVPAVMGANIIPQPSYVQEKQGTFDLAHNNNILYAGKHPEVNQIIDNFMEQVLGDYGLRLQANKSKKAGILLQDKKSLNEEAYENIIMPLSECTDIFLRKKGLSISVCNKRMHLKNDNELITEFYEKKCPKYLEIKFQTPTAFKSDGKYVIYPDLGLIYASLMRKYSAVSEAFDMFDEETLEALVEQSEIVRYRLQTVPFPLEKVQITGFTGSICIHIRGPETMARYLRMLFKFGEFAGVGIKTGMGMGAMKYVRRNEDD